MTDQQTAAGSIPDGPSNCFPFPDHDHQTEPGNPLLTRHVRQLVNAGAFAAARGIPWTAHVTIHFRLAERFTPETWADFQSHLLDRMSRWLARKGVPVAFGWVRENGPVKGEHLHLFLHLPQPLWGAFKRHMLKAGGFAPYDAGGEAIRISGGRFGMYAETMRAGAARYVLKSLSPTTCEALGIKHHPTLPVPIKRCGVNHAISQQAREAAGWREYKTVSEIRAHLHPAPANDNQAEEVGDAA